MKTILMPIFAMLFSVSSAHALTIDPLTGKTGFNWWTGGVGASSVFTEPDFSLTLPDALASGDDMLEITVAADSFVDFNVLDCCLVGDTFDLILDGSTVAWTTSGFTAPGGYFEAFATGLFLTAGLHTFDLLTTSVATVGVQPGDEGTGTADWSVSAATVAVAVVPLPAALPLLVAGIGLIGFAGRRRKPKAT